MAAAGYTIPSRGPGWLHGAATDLFIGAGLAYVLTVPALLWLGHALALERWPLEVTLILGLAFSAPHYGATLLRVYERREDRRRYRLFAVHTSLALIVLLGFAIRVPLLGALVITVYLAWGPWHFAGQNYGLALMFLRRGGIDVSPSARRWLYASFVLSFVLTLLVFQTSDSTASFAPDPWSGGVGYHALRVGIPTAFTAVAAPLLLIGYAACLVAAFVQLRRDGANARDFAPVGLLALTQSMWFLVPATAVALGRPVEGLAFTAVWASVAHSAQYLWVTSYYAGRTEGAKRFPHYYTQALLAGCLITVLPGLVCTPFLPANLSWTGGFAILLFSLVNLHHFILDGAIWKLRDGSVARVLLRDEPDAGSDAREGERRGGLRALVWTAAALCLAVPVVETWDTFAAHSGDLDRVQSAARRLALLGRERIIVLGTLGDLHLHRGDERTAQTVYRHALTLRRDPAVVNNLSWLLAVHAEPSPATTREAIALAEEAVDHYGEDDSEALDTLAAAYAAAGRFDDAERAGARALDQARENDAELADSIRSRLALYRARHPYRGE